MTVPTPASLTPEQAAEDHGYHIIIAAVLMVTFVTLATVLWFWSRRLSKNGFMWCDILMPASLFFNLALCTSVLLSLRWRLGRHEVSLPPDQIWNDYHVIVVLLFYVCPPLYLCGVTVAKLCILNLYMHIFIDKFSRYTIYCVGVVLGLSWLVNFITFMTQCRPFYYPWKPTTNLGGNCEDVLVHLTYNILPNILTDVALLALPIPMILKLNATTRRKLSVMLVFLVGSLGLGISIGSFAVYIRLFQVDVLYDLTWYATLPLILAIVESGTYHLTACMMMMGPLLKWISSKNRASSVQSSTRDTSIESRITKPPQVREKSLSTQSGSSRTNNGSHMSSDFSSRTIAFAEHSAAADVENRRFNHLESCIFVEHEVQVVKSWA